MVTRSPLPHEDEGARGENSEDERLALQNVDERNKAITDDDEVTTDNEAAGGRPPHSYGSGEPGQSPIMGARALKPTENRPSPTGYSQRMDQGLILGSLTSSERTSVMHSAALPTNLSDVYDQPFKSNSFAYLPHIGRSEDDRGTAGGWSATGSSTRDLLGEVDNKIREKQEQLDRCASELSDTRRKLAESKKATRQAWMEVRMAVDEEREKGERRMAEQKDHLERRAADMKRTHDLAICRLQTNFDDELKELQDELQMQRRAMEELDEAKSRVEEIRIQYTRDLEVERDKRMIAERRLEDVRKSEQGLLKRYTELGDNLVTQKHITEQNVNLEKAGRRIVAR